MDQDRSSLQEAIQKEERKFEEAYAWLEAHMPPSLFVELGQEKMILVAYSLVAFNLQDCFSQIHLKTSSIVLCLDVPDADLRILSHYRMAGIRNYRAFVSNASPPDNDARLRVATISFDGDGEQKPLLTEIFPVQKQQEIFQQLHKRNPNLTHEEFTAIIGVIDLRFLKSLTHERLIVCLEMYFRAKTRDQCQYLVRYNEDWKEKRDAPSMQIVMAWRNVPKHNFLYRLAKVIQRYSLRMTRVNASYVEDPMSKNDIMLLSFGLHGSKGKAAWEEANLTDFLQELVTVKYFEGMEPIEHIFVDSGLVSGNLGNFIKTMVYFVHQALVHADLNMYSFSHVEEGFCRHPELTTKLCEAFAFRFHPTRHDEKEFAKISSGFLELVDHIDTGNELNDSRRKNILRQGMNFIRYTLKTNFYRNNKSAFCFRLDPAYLLELPYEYQDKFPEIPFAVFFMKGMHFMGFHIRFKDLSRGGLRTVCPASMEQFNNERNNVFAECYALSYTQQKKNKDIPEGGAKGIILLEPYESMRPEAEIYRRELLTTGLGETEIESRLNNFEKQHKLEFLYQSQRAYIDSFMTLINCHPDGTLKAKDMIDYYKKPEYIYLGPDENAHNIMIEWIAQYSKQVGYKPGGTFISSKPSAGINHKEFGVTSLGVNVYLEETLKFLGLDPTKDAFTIKMTGGPDGDVAGNELHNLFLFYPKTAKLLALTDASGTIYDPEGLDLAIIDDLFHRGVTLNAYPPEKLHDEGFLLDVRKKREQTAYAQQSLCWRKNAGKLEEDWLSGNEMNHLWRHNILQTQSDIFIPAGGRPRTLNDSNWKDFLDEMGKPTSRAIIEGANLFLTPSARRSLEKLSVLIIKDSSANKGGVICSSFEVLSGLIMTEEEFLRDKPELVKEILQIIEDRARDEARLLLQTFQDTGEFLTDLSEKISERINTYAYQLLDYLQPTSLPTSTEDPLIRCLLHYCPPLLRKHYTKRILTDLPDIHKKAVISCYIAQRLVYQRGLNWSPTLVDVLPLVVQDPNIVTHL